MGLFADTDAYVTLGIGFAISFGAMVVRDKIKAIRQETHETDEIKRLCSSITILTTSVNELRGSLNEMRMLMQEHFIQASGESAVLKEHERRLTNIEERT